MHPDRHPRRSVPWKSETGPWEFTPEAAISHPVGWPVPGFTLPVRRLHRCASILASPHRFKGSMVPGHPIETWGQDDDPPFVTLLRQRL